MNGNPYEQCFLIAYFLQYILKYCVSFQYFVIYMS